MINQIKPFSKHYHSSLFYFLILHLHLDNLDMPLNPVRYIFMQGFLSYAF